MEFYELPDELIEKTSFLCRAELSVPELKIFFCIQPTCSTKCSLFSLLHLHVCTPSNFFTTILIYNCWLFPPQIHWLRNRLHRLFRCALKKFSPNETVWRSENMIIIIILVIQDSSLFLAFFSRDFSYQLLCLGRVPIYIQRKSVKIRLNLRWSWLYGKHVRH